MMFNQLLVQITVIIIPRAHLIEGNLFYLRDWFIS